MTQEEKEDLKDVLEALGATGQPTIIGTVIGCQNNTVNINSNPAKKEKDVAESAADDDEIITQLLPAFNFDTEVTEEFLRFAKSVEDKSQITDMVKSLYAEGKIAHKHARRHIWKPLHDKGIYPCSETNWNNHIGSAIP